MYIIYNHQKESGKFVKKCLTIGKRYANIRKLSRGTAPIKQNLSNQENPYYYGYIPLIALDLWEHAYYINYENKKDIYIDNFFEIIDFSQANKNYRT